MAINLVIITILASSFAGTMSLDWKDDVYTGRHLDALITTSTENNGYVLGPAVLFLYKPQCMSTVQAYISTLSIGGPPGSYLSVLKHDYETAPKHIWYDLDSIDDIKSRYIIEGDDCMKVLFFQASYHVSRPFLFSEKSSKNFLEWIWSFLKVNLDIENALNHTVIVFAEGNGAKEHLGTIESGKGIQVHSHFTRAITVYNTTEKPLYGFRIRNELVDNDWKVTINYEDVEAFKPWENDDYNYWLNNMMDNQDMIEQRKSRLHWLMAETELITYKQPLMLKRFTKDGYKKTKIPDMVYKRIRKFYDENQHLRLSEGDWDDMEPQINTDSVQTTVVPLPDEEREATGGALLAEMEEWCDCKLKTTAFYGIREYYHGNVLRMHVDNVETHIISLILLIHKKLNAQQDWALEVIDYDGKRQSVTLEEGEMLMYESGTLIHGRPLPYQGSIFANCFLHYMPVEGWKWQRYYVQGQPIITDGSKTERVDQIDTPLTLRKEHQEIKDEL